MSKQPHPERPDSDNPEWRDEDFDRAKPARQVLGELFDAEQVAEIVKAKRRQTTAKHVR